MQEVSFSITIPPVALRVLFVLESAGYPAYVVGGSLRDALRGEAPHDWDITTAALPDKMLFLFAQAGLRTIETGIKHGTVTVLVDGEPVECTTYRLDGDYTDGRHPDEVFFTDRIADDLCRRDFTVNAMALRLPQVISFPEEVLSRGWTVATAGGDSEVELLDLFGGRADLAAGVIRCVGESERRFTEDALRILRCVRFCVQLGYRAKEETIRALIACRHRLSMVSPERRASELLRMLTAPMPLSYGLSLMNRAELWGEVLPLCHPSEQNRMRTALLPPDAALRLAQLYARGASETSRAMAAARDGCGALRLSRALTDEVVLLTGGMYEPYPQTDAALRHLMARYGMFAEKILLLCALNGASEEMIAVAQQCCDAISASWQAVLRRCGEIRARGDCLTVAQLAIDGRDLFSMGLRGVQIGQMLSRLLYAVLEEPMRNTPEMLRALAEEFLVQGDCKEGKE